MDIYLLTMPDGTFGSAGQSWKKLNIIKIIKLINHKVKIISFNDLDGLRLSIDDILIYTSSDNPTIRHYIKNRLFFIKDECRLIPSYELLMAHEDKGFQEILKNKKKLGNLKGNYIFDIENELLGLPKVLKTTEGAGSSGVFLIKDKNDLKKIKRDFYSQPLKRKVIKIQRKIKLTKKQYEIYNYRYKKFNLFIEQEFISNLQHDFKVLVFGDRYFVLKRSVRKNDFRASGSGDFEFIDPPHEVLSFAKNITSILDNPYLSLDIAQSEYGCHLIEFQATNFGPYTLLNAPKRYTFNGNSWLAEENCKDLEANYAYALNHYIGRKYD